jgi:hypothetical protein
VSTLQGIPAGAAVAINDMLDHCAKIKPGQEVLILAQLDGLYGGDNLVDREAISWIQTAVQMRGANASVLWFDEPVRVHAWRFPPVVKAAISAADIFINHSFDLTIEEIDEFRKFVLSQNKIMVRNFATTAPLLCSRWAQTPQELVNEIRYQAALPIKEGLSWKLVDNNGTHLSGKILPAFDPFLPFFPTYTTRREEAGPYRPWPEWVHPPIRISETSGVFIFDYMLSWWSRYIGISPYFSKSIRLTIENNRITRIEGGDEAEALRGFLEVLRQKLGEGVYNFNAVHFGVHPQAQIAAHQCPSVLYRRLIEHCHSSNIHVHIGAPESTPAYPYWAHITGDIRTATLQVGDTLIMDRGYLTALDHPAVRAVAAKYPGRPGLDPEPRSD